MLSGTRQKTVSESLHLQPGEWVEVKSREEIEATLDVHGKTRGLAFVAEQSLYCGKRYRVARRVDRMIQENTGEMRDLKDTVALEEVTCMGLAPQRRCPRGCFHLWRESWAETRSGWRSGCFGRGSAVVADFVLTAKRRSLANTNACVGPNVRVDWAPVAFAAVGTDGPLPQCTNKRGFAAIIQASLTGGMKSRPKLTMLCVLPIFTRYPAI